MHARTHTHSIELMSVNSVGTTVAFLFNRSIIFKNESFLAIPGRCGFLFSLPGPVFPGSWLLSLLQAGKKQGCFQGTAPSPLTQRLRPLSGSVFTTSICSPRRIRSQLSRPLRKAICRIPLAFPAPSGLAVQMSAFSFPPMGFAQQKYTTV